MTHAHLTNAHLTSAPPTNRSFFQRLWLAVTLFGLAATIALVFVTQARAADLPFKFYTAEKSFEDAKFDLEDAITEKGLKIESTGDLKGMLERTGKDIGATKKIYKGAMYLSFCSAVLSRGAMEADPKNMVFCPYTVYLYETLAEPGKTHIGYRLLQWPGSEASNKALAKVNELLDDIVKTAAE